MRNYKDSDYALNRYSQGIVYKFADSVVEVTLEDYLRDNPDKTEADFAELKTLSDEIYYQQDRQEYRVSHRNVSISGMEDAIVASAPSVDMELIQKDEENAPVGERKADCHTEKTFLSSFFSWAFHEADCEIGRRKSENRMGKPDVGREKTEKNL